MENQSKTSNWINWLVISIVFFELITTTLTVRTWKNPLTELAPEERLKFMRGNKKDFYYSILPRLFFVTLRILYKENNKESRFECAGAVLNRGIFVLTHSNCFFHRIKTEANKAIRDIHRPLEITYVDVLVGDFQQKEMQVPIDVEYVDVPADPLTESFAKVKLALNATQELIKLLSASKRLYVEPLQLCNADSWSERRIKDKRVVIAGLACSNMNTSKSNTLWGNVPKKWQEMRMEITDTEKNCKNSNVKRQSRGDVVRYCAAGTSIGINPENKQSTYLDMNAFDSYEKICEDLGGPVFISNLKGEAECFVGVVDGIAQRSSNGLNIQHSLKTNDDWFNGIEFTSIETVKRQQNMKRLWENNAFDNSFEYLQKAAKLRQQNKTKQNSENSGLKSMFSALKQRLTEKT